MKFIVDAQLPRKLSNLLNNQGHDSIHTLELLDRNKTKDNIIIETAIEKDRITITKDRDFLDSYLLKKEPPKLILVRTGNISNKELLKLFQQNIGKIVEVLNEVSLIEMYSNEIIIHSTK